MTTEGSHDELVERGDLDEPLRVVNNLCSAQDWEGLLALRERCEQAVERGRQLWPIARHVEYRLALEAPGAWAAGVLLEDLGRFTLGPLAEVAASTHTWTELADHLEAGPVASLFAHERVIRGEDLTAAGPLNPPVLDLPLRLAEWEPRYAVAEYHSDEAHFPTPAMPRLRPIMLPAAAEQVSDVEGCDALVDLVSSWTTTSDGRAECVAVDGTAADALAALGLSRARWAEVDLADAVAHMAWAGASGGAYGRRRGAATGRFGAWWVIAALSGVLDEWPVAADRLGTTGAGLRWHLWDASEPVTGWSLHLTVERPATGRSWALAATDARHD